MGTRVHYEIGSPASLILRSNSSHASQNPEAMFRALVLEHKGAPTALVRALLAATYNSLNGPNRAGDPIFTIAVESEDREYDLIANVESGAVSVRRVETPYQDSKHELLRPAFERLMTKLHLADNFDRYTVATADRHNEVSGPQDLAYPNQYVVAQVEAYWLIYKTLTKPVGVDIAPFEREVRAFFHTLRGQGHGLDSDVEKVAKLKGLVDRLGNDLNKGAPSAKDHAADAVLILIDIFARKGLSLKAIALQKLEELRVEIAEQEESKPQTRQRMMPGTVIACAGEQVVVLEDDGGDKVLVNDEGVALFWDMDLDDDPCVVVTPYVPTAEEIERYCIKREPYKGFTCVSFATGNALFRNVEGSEVRGSSPEPDEWQAETWASAMALIDRQITSEENIASYRAQRDADKA